MRRLSYVGLMCFSGTFAPNGTLLVYEEDDDGIYISGAEISAEKGLLDTGLAS